MSLKGKSIKKELRNYIDGEKKIILPKFFKTGKGQYGEGDSFLGISVPNIRIVSRNYLDVSLDVVEELLNSQWHEERMCALLILVESFKKSGHSVRSEIYQFYLTHTSSINNWDLVDLTAPNIVGAFLLHESNRSDLYKLANSSLLWNQRIAIVSTLAFIRNDDFVDTLQLAELFLFHPHDLMQKATGWMLREVGKHNVDLLIAFLDKHGSQMPRTMLRYAIEKFPQEQRLLYLHSTK